MSAVLASATAAPPASSSQHPGLSPSLAAARNLAQELGLPYAGGLTPLQAWQVFQAGDAVLVDVRSKEEIVFVGQVPGSVHVPWATGTSLTRNPRFVRELEAKVPKTRAVLLLCRSGKRSALAAAAATQAGFDKVFNVLEGFEGDLDEHGQRGQLNGWRSHALPWVQE